MNFPDSESVSKTSEDKKNKIPRKSKQRVPEVGRSVQENNDLKVGKIVAAMVALFLLWFVFDSGKIISYADLAGMDCSVWTDDEYFDWSDVRSGCDNAKSEAQVVVAGGLLGALICLLYIISPSKKKPSNSRNRETNVDPKILDRISRPSWLGICILIFLFSIFVFNGMINDWGRASQGLGNLITFFNESLWPPDWSVLEPQAYPVCTVYPNFMDFTCSTAWIGMVETIKIAFVSTVFGTILSLPLSLLAARNLNPSWVSYSSRFFLAAFRSLPSLIWAIFFVILVGFGPLAGVLAMTVYTVGYLGKLQYEAIEGMAKIPLDASEAMGLTKFETALKVVIPESANDLISQAIFMFEYNFRHGTVIGIVGAGGIGYYINLYLKFLQYDKVIAYLIIIFVVVLIIDFISIKARSYFTEEIDLPRSTWKSIFLPSFPN